MDPPDSTAVNLNIDSNISNQTSNATEIDDNFIEELFNSLSSDCKEPVSEEARQSNTGLFSAFSGCIKKEDPPSPDVGSDSLPPAPDVIDEVSLMIQKLKQQNKELKEKNLEQECELQNYEERLAEKMDDLLRIQLERDALKQSLELAESGKSNIEMKFAEKEAELKQFKGLVQKNIVDENEMQTLRKNLTFESKLRIKIEKEHVRIVNLLSQRTAMLKKIRCGSKKIASTLLQFGSILEEKGMLNSKQIRYLKAVKEDQLTDVSGTNGGIEENGISPKKENDSDDYQISNCHTALFDTDLPFSNGNKIRQEALPSSDDEPPNCLSNGGTINSVVNDPALRICNGENFDSGAHNSTNFAKSSNIATSTPIPSHHLQNGCINHPETRNHNTANKKNLEETDKIQNSMSIPQFKPISNSPDPFFTLKKTDSVCSEDFMDVTDDDFATMKRQVSLKNEQILPLSPLPPTPPPKLLTKAPSSVLKAGNMDSIIKPDIPSETSSFAPKSEFIPAVKSDKKRNLCHQTSNGFEPHMESPDPHKIAFVNNCVSHDSAMMSNHALPPELCYISSQQVNKTLFITNTGGCDFDYLVNLNSGHSAFAISPHDSPMSFINQSDDSIFDSKLSSPFHDASERLKRVYSYFKSTENHMPSKRSKTLLFPPTEQTSHFLPVRPNSNVDDGYVSSSTQISATQTSSGSHNPSHPENDSVFMTPRAKDGLPQQEGTGTKVKNDYQSFLPTSGASKLRRSIQFSDSSQKSSFDKGASSSFVEPEAVSSNLNEKQQMESPPKIVDVKHSLGKNRADFKPMLINVGLSVVGDKNKPLSSVSDSVSNAMEPKKPSDNSFSISSCKSEQFSGKDSTLIANSKQSPEAPLSRSVTKEEVKDKCGAKDIASSKIVNSPVKETKTSSMKDDLKVDSCTTEGTVSEKSLNPAVPETKTPKLIKSALRNGDICCTDGTVSPLKINPIVQETKTPVLRKIDNEKEIKEICNKECTVSPTKVDPLISEAKTPNLSKSAIGKEVNSATKDSASSLKVVQDMSVKPNATTSENRHLVNGNVKPVLETSNNAISGMPSSKWKPIGVPSAIINQSCSSAMSRAAEDVTVRKNGIKRQHKVQITEPNNETISKTSVGLINGNISSSEVCEPLTKKQKIEKTDPVVQNGVNISNSATDTTFEPQFNYTIKEPKRRISRVKSSDNKNVKLQSNANKNSVIKTYSKMAIKSNNASSPKNLSFKQSYNLKSSEKKNKKIKGGDVKAAVSLKKKKKRSKNKHKKKKQQKAAEVNLHGNNINEKQCTGVTNLPKVELNKGMDASKIEVAAEQNLPNGSHRTFACVANADQFDFIQSEDEKLVPHNLDTTPDCDSLTKNVISPAKNVISPARNVISPARNVISPTKNVIPPAISPFPESPLKDATAPNNSFVVQADVHWDKAKDESPDMELPIAKQVDNESSSLSDLPVEKEKFNFCVLSISPGLFASNVHEKASLLPDIVHFHNGTSFANGFSSVLSPKNPPIKKGDSLHDETENLMNGECSGKNQEVSPLSSKIHFSSSPSNIINSDKICTLKEKGILSNNIGVNGVTSPCQHKTRANEKDPTVLLNGDKSPIVQQFNDLRDNYQSSACSDDEHALIIAEEPEEMHEPLEEDVVENINALIEYRDTVIDPWDAIIDTWDKPNNRAKSKKKKTPKLSANAHKKLKTPHEEIDNSLTISKAFEEMEKLKFDESHFKLRVHTLVNALINPSNAPDTVSVLFKVIQYLCTSRRNPFMSYSICHDVSMLLPNLERCIVTSLIQVESKMKNHLNGLLASAVHSMYLLVLAKDSIPIYGLCALCRVLTEVCKSTKNCKKPIRLCCDLLKMQHKFAPYLIASIVGLWPEIFVISEDATDVELRYQSAIIYGLDRKPKTLTDTQWKHCAAIFTKFLSAPAISDVTRTTNNITKTIKSVLGEEAFEEEYMLTDPLVIFSAYEGWEWTESKLLNPFIIPSLGRYAQKQQNERAFTLFCDLYSEIGLLAPSCVQPIEVLLQFFFLEDAYDYVKHTAARSLLKLFLLKSQIIPNYLSQWIEENQTSLTKSSTEQLLRRRLMLDTHELTEEDIVTI